MHGAQELQQQCRSCRSCRRCGTNAEIVDHAAVMQEVQNVGGPGAAAGRMISNMSMYPYLFGSSKDFFFILTIFRKIKALAPDSVLFSS